MAGKRTGENWLSAKAVASAKEGLHADGGGLYLQVRGASRAWLYRYQIAGRRREKGLGSLRVMSLAEARQARDAARRLVAQGIDPLARQVVLRPRLWGDAADEFIAARRGEWKTEAQAHQWEQSLRDHGPSRTLPVAELDTDAVLACLQPLWKPKAQGGKVETATRLRGRIERIWDAEKVRGAVAGENPARWKGHLEHLLPKPRKVQPPRHFAAMPFADLPEFVRALRSRDGITRRALLWTILNAARTEETLGLHRREIVGTEWRIPASRMKGGRPHVVPLTPDALVLLEGLPAHPWRLSENAMLNLVQDPAPHGFGLPYTVHGFRSSFFDWAHETMGFPKFVVDMALAHKIADKADAAYRRGALLEKRRDLMQAWADYLHT